MDGVLLGESIVRLFVGGKTPTKVALEQMLGDVERAMYERSSRKVEGRYKVAVRLHSQEAPATSTTTRDPGALQQRTLAHPALSSRPRNKSHKAPSTAGRSYTDPHGRPGHPNP